MFCDAEHFNQPLNYWNVTNVICMKGVFLSAKYFNQNINDWNVHFYNLFQIKNPSAVLVLKFRTWDPAHYL